MKDAHDGTIVLPDFQRSFIWEPEDVREMLVSVMGNYFTGSMLLLEDFRDESPFALRFVEGLEKVNDSAKMQSIVKILLDGQQRTTALFYALFEPDIPLKKRRSSYRFYFDLDNGLKKDWDKAIVAVNTKDTKFAEVNHNPNIIPISYFKDVGKLATEFKNHPNFREIIELANAFMTREIHTVFLPRGTDPERIVETFERINRTGEPLSIFELITARLYKSGIKLRDLLKDAKKNYRFLEEVNPEPVLKVIALLRGKEPKRKNILELEAENLPSDWDGACEALQTAYDRSLDVKHGFGVLGFKKWMPYTTMLVPLAAMIDYIRDQKLETGQNYRKIHDWYWVAVFSNRYDQAADTASATDFWAMKDWAVDDSKVPDIIQKFVPDIIDLDVDKRSSAIYKGVINMVVLKGALDFKTGEPPQFGKEKIQDDHIFPSSIYHYDGIANRTLISTNAEKKDKKPSEYFKERLQQHGEDKLKIILESHLIPEDALKYLLEDDLDNFVKSRKKAIANEIVQKLR